MAEKALRSHHTKRKRISSTKSHDFTNTTNTTTTTITKRRRILSSPNRNWSDLPLELLELILKNLSFFDNIRFKSVCSSWNRAAKSCTAPTPPPMLMRTSTRNSETTFSLFSIAENRSYEIHKVFEGFHDDCEARCGGSSYGWLAIWNYELMLNLFSPFSQSTIELPLIRTHFIKHKLHKYYVKKVVLSSSPSHDNNFTVVVLLSEGERLKFYRYGTEEEEWTSFGQETKKYCDVVFHEGRLFALAVDYSLEAWEFGKTYPYPTKTMAVAVAAEDRFYKSAWLVVSMGELLLVKKELFEFLIYKFDFTAKKWEEVETLGIRALCLSEIQSAISISTLECPEFEQGWIYGANGEYIMDSELGTESSPLVWVVPT